MKKKEGVKNKELITIDLESYKDLLESERVLKELAKYRFAISPKGLYQDEFFRFKIYKDKNLKFNRGWQEQTLIKTDIIFSSAQNFAKDRDAILRTKHRRGKGANTTKAKGEARYMVAKGVFQFLESTEKLPIKRSQIVEAVKPVWKKQSAIKLPAEKRLFDFQTRYLSEKQ